MNKIKIVLTATLLLGLCQSLRAEEEILNFPVQTQSAIPSEPVVPLEPGTTAGIAEDLSARHRSFEVGTPDHSYRSIWVRIFPLVKVPFGDPYSKTRDPSHLSIMHDAGLTLYDGSTHQMVAQGRDLEFDFAHGAFTVDKKKFVLKDLWITTNNSTPLEMDWDKKTHHMGVRLRGGIQIEQTKFADGLTRWSAVNVLNLDQYLLSVVASEALTSWHPAALQAQAIAARTFALREIANARKASRNWDLDPTTQYQSYRGQSFFENAWYTIEHDVTTAAVSATAGLGLLYDNEVIEAYFSANSGGTTCSAQECFNQPGMPYLQALPDAPGITDVAGGTWGQKANVTPVSITRTLHAIGIKPRSRVVSLEALKVGASGRTWALQVRLASGVINLNSDQTGRMMGLFGAMRSHLFHLGGSTHGRQSVMGHGYGHGVGLCQWGAQLYAQAGWTADKILAYYYPGTTLKDLRLGLP